jgi:lipopolysaccharide transport system ATP-binding protein
VLAVGDVRFQKKCLEKMGELGESGRTVIFVSHSMPAITRLCRKAILLRDGQVVKNGPSHLVIGTYLESGFGSRAIRKWANTANAPGDEVVKLCSVRIKRDDEQSCDSFDISEPILIEIEYDVLRDGAVLVPAAQITNQEGVIVLHSGDWDPRARKAGHYKSCTRIPGNLLAEGMFFVTVSISTPSPIIKRIVERDIVAFQISETKQQSSMRQMWGGYHPGVVRPNLEWSTVVSKPPAHE